MAASFRFPRAGFFRLCRAILARDYGPCDYDIRHNLNAQYVYELPVQVRSHSLGLRAQWLADFRNRVLA